MRDGFISTKPVVLGHSNASENPTQNYERANSLLPSREKARMRDNQKALKII